jgi:Big-like domain-containing protein/VCBS repeat protein
MKSSRVLFVLAMIAGHFGSGDLFAGTNHALELQRIQTGVSSTKRQLSPIHAWRAQSTGSLKGTASSTKMGAQLVSNTAPSQVGFLSALPLDVRGGAFSRAVAGDFNGDGKRDLAVAVFEGFGSQATFSLAVLLANGDGTFQSAVTTPIEANFGDPILVADLNSDGIDDIIFAHYGYLEVFLSAGDGTFRPPLGYADGADNVGAIALWDVNHDHNLDLVLADRINASLSILLGNGDGTFQPFAQKALPGPFNRGTLADVNGDGTLDLITDSQVFLGLPSGFDSGTPLTNPSGLFGNCEGREGSVSVADLNADGRADVLVSDCWRNSVNIFLNNGDGTFATGSAQWTGIFTEAIAIADVNNDNTPDIISTNGYSADVTVALGNGDGSFRSPVTGNASGGFALDASVVADFDGDGKEDLAVAISGPDLSFALTYFKGNGDGTFAAARNSYSPPTSNPGFAYGLSVATADLNGDGVPDVILGNTGPSEMGITIFLGNKDGTLQPGVNYGSGGYLTSVAAADVDSDGNVDVVASTAVSGGQLNIFLGNGDGTLRPQQTFGPDVSGPFVDVNRVTHGLVIGDFNGDGKPDAGVLSTGPAGVIVYLQNDEGTFLAPVTYSLNNEGWELISGDLNGDGILDLVVPQSVSDSVSIFLGREDGTFVALPDLALGSRFPVSAVIADINHDGKADLVVTNNDWINGSGIDVALGNGDGTFATPVVYPASTRSLPPLQPYPSEITVSDFDKDGNLDLIYTNSGYSDVGVSFGKGDGTFYDPVEFRVGGYPYGLVLTDINGDGALDAIVGADEFSGVTVMLGTAGTSVTLSSSANPTSYGTPLTLTATVAPTVRGVRATAGGTVTFSDGNAVLGTGSLSSGQATLILPALSVGTHTLHATYSGDLAFYSSTSSDLVQVVDAAVNPDYQLTASPESATIQPGQSAMFTITASPLNGFNGVINFDCGSLPAGITCQFSPADLTLDGVNPSSVQLTISSSAQMLGAIPTRSGSHGSLPFWLTVSGGAFGLVMVEGLSQRRRRLVVAIACFLIVAALVPALGCGGTNSTVPGATQKSKTVQVTATAVAAGPGSFSRQLTLTVNIQQ